MPPSIAIKFSRFRHDPDMGPPKRLADTVTVMANPLLMASALRENAGAKQSLIDLESWMVRYQRADPEAPRALIVALSPALLRFFRSQIAIREQAGSIAEDLDADSSRPAYLSARRAGSAVGVCNRTTRWHRRLSPNEAHQLARECDGGTAGEAGAR